MAALTGNTLADRVAARCRDAACDENTQVNYLLFMNDAVADLHSAGWYMELEENEATSLITGDYDYDVPATFVTIHELRMADALGEYEIIIPRWQWRIGYKANKPQFFLDSRYFTLINGRTIKVIGQRRFADLVDVTAVPIPIIAFIRERAVYYAANALMAGTSELARERARIAEQAWNLSEVLLMNAPDECRILPGSRLVPGR